MRNRKKPNESISSIGPDKEPTGTLSELSDGIVFIAICMKTIILDVAKLDFKVLVNVLVNTVGRAI